MPVRASIILTTYNRPDALAAVLRALGSQSAVGDFEVVVADDGSRPDTAQLIAGLAAQLPFALKHVWQEDVGFRAARSRNLAVASSEGDYLIFLDGDCVPFPDFIAQHLRLAERGWLVSGNRVMTTQAFTRKIVADGLRVDTWPLWRWFVARMRGDIRRVLPLIRLPFRGFKWRTKQRWYGAKTCNLAVWRGDFMNVDGFDELFSGWGHEDADLVARLIASGTYRKSGRFSVPVLHLWHAEARRSDEAANMARLQQNIAGGRVRAVQGVSSHLNPGLPA